MYEIIERREGFATVQLSPRTAPAPFDQALNVHVLHDDQSIALIHCGDASQRPDLLAALESLGLDPRRVDRVVATAHRADLIAGIHAFPHADLCLLASPSRAPFRSLSARLLRAAQALNEAQTSIDLAQLERACQAALPDVALEQTPTLWLEDGQPLNLAGHRLNVIATPGMNPGAMALLDVKRGWLFVGDFLQRTNEFCWIQDPKALAETLERLGAIPTKRLFRSDGVSTPKPDWALRHLSMLLTHFASNLPYAINGMVTPAEIVERDLSLTPQTPLQYVAATLGYLSMFETLHANHALNAEGEGITGRFGTGVTTSRALRETK